MARFEIGADHVDVPLPVLTPSRCVASPRVPVDFLGTSEQGALFAVGGDVMAIPHDASPRPVPAESLALAPGATVESSARRDRPDGAALATWSPPRGVLVATPKGAQPRSPIARSCWTTPTLDNATACAPNDAADRIACAVKGAVAIYDAR